MPDDALPYLWTVDHAVLIHIVRQLEIEGERNADMGVVRDAVGLTNDETDRAVKRLQKAEMIEVGGTRGLGGFEFGSYLVNGVTEHGLQKAGAWPGEAENLAGQLIAALTEAAENETDPAEKSKLRTAASSLGAVGQKTFVEVVASYVAKVSGA